jgi:hypothetical protein
MIVRLSNNLIARKMSQKNDIYCANENYKQNYIKNAQQIKETQELSSIRSKFIDTLIEIQNTNLGIGKLRTLCWYEFIDYYF